jgi:IS4 transposase
LADFRRGNKLGAKDHLIEWRKPARVPVWLSAQAYAQLPEVFVIREFAVDGRIYVSTLDNAKLYPKTELAALYGMRWNIELDIRSIKTHMGMEMLRCQSADMVRKEIAVHMLAYNLIRTNIAQAAAVHNKLPRLISFRAAVQLVNQAALQLAHLFGTLMKNSLDSMLAMIVATWLGVRIPS